MLIVITLFFIVWLFSPCCPRNFPFLSHLLRIKGPLACGQREQDAQRVRAVMSCELVAHVKVKVKGSSTCLECALRVGQPGMLGGAGMCTEGYGRASCS